MLLQNRDRKMKTRNENNSHYGRLLSEYVYPGSRVLLVRFMEKLADFHTTIWCSGRFHGYCAGYRRK